MSGWQSSNRRAELPRNWPTIRRAVKRRANGRCQAATHEPECDGIGTDCDHVGDRDDHSLGNLQWLSGPCHRAKTLEEAAHARGQGRARAPRTHPSQVAYRT